MIKRNTDEAQDTASKYQISALPTVIAFHRGMVVDKFVGMRDAKFVKNFVEKHSELADK